MSGVVWPLPYLAVVEAEALRERKGGKGSLLESRSWQRA